MGWRSIGTAVLLNYWIGQRQGDVLRLPRHSYKDGKFWITQSKCGARVHVPMPQWLINRIEVDLQDQKVAGIQTLLVCEATGQTWKEDLFRKKFALVRAQLAEEVSGFEYFDGTTLSTGSLWFMHLRHTAVTALGEANCSDILISSITGHSLETVKTVLERYLVRTSKMAEEASDMRQAAGDYSMFEGI